MTATKCDKTLDDLSSENILAVSDAVGLVERVRSGAVDLCYIDPPLFPKVDEASKKELPRIMREHLLSLAKVLQHARRCLAATGNGFVHSEPEMNGSIRLLLDQIFGRQSFRQEIVVPRPAPRIRGGLPTGHDTLFHFSVGPDFVFNVQTRELTPNEIASQFTKSDDHGAFRVVSLVSSVARPALGFEWAGTRPPAGRSWRYSRERLEQLQAEGRIVFSSSGNAPGLNLKKA